MNRILPLCLAICLVTGLVACKTRTIYTPVEIHTIDSTVIRDTVLDIQLVPYRDSVAVNGDSSFLSNPYAYSWAVWKNGVLHHSLGIWPKQVQLQLNYIEKIKRIEIPKPYPVIEIEYVEKKLSFIQKARQVVGDIALSGLGIYLIIWLLKRRK